MDSYWWWTDGVDECLITSDTGSSSTRGSGFLFKTRPQGEFDWWALPIVARLISLERERKGITDAVEEAFSFIVERG